MLKNTIFTRFWTSTERARRRSAKQQHMRVRKEKRKPRINSEKFIQIRLPRGLSIKKQIGIIKHKCPYKLRKSELKGLQMFLAQHLHLDVVALPKQRPPNNQSIDFTDSCMMYMDIPK